MNYLSVCSGIEAASEAWKDLNWNAVAFSEIEAFPCTVLQHHYPNVPNIGDMTKINGEDYRGKIDLIVGGTPCQDFTIAGRREGLEGERGRLTLSFVRLVRDVQPRWVVWENVPGILSIHERKPFGIFCKALSDIGYCFSWRILNSRYFGVAQQRRRVFLVGYYGDWRPTAKVLFNPQGLCGITAESSVPQSEIIGTITSQAYSGGFAGRPDGARANHFIPHSKGVRTLTPIEFERLQGFPDNYTLVHYRGGAATNGLRYKALGNSMPVPVMKWIGERIQKFDE